jgi:hypothetical protein
LNVPKAQSLTAFLQGINDLNKREYSLLNHSYEVAIRSGVGFNGAAVAAKQFESAIFKHQPSSYVSGTNIGVDIVIGTGDAIETECLNQYFNQKRIIQIHTSNTDAQLATGALYQYKLQTTPVDSFQGNVYF